MYTRCPGCSSTFRVTAALLQMAEGDVRCGSCGMVFNALHTLVDDWSGTAPDAPQRSGDEGTAPPPEAAPGPDSSAPDEAATVEETLEFDAPEREWQRFFIAAEGTPLSGGTRAEPELGAEFGAAEGEEEAATLGADAEPDAARDEAAGPGRSLEEETADTDTWQAFLRDSDAPTDEDAGPPYVIIEDDAPDAPVEIVVRRETVVATGSPTIFEIEPDDADSPEEPTVADGGFDGTGNGADRVPDGPPVETVLDWGPPPAFSQPAPRASTHWGRWLVASAAMAVLLAGQVVHHFRDQLAADAHYGELVRDGYERLGQPLYPAWPLDAYEIRGAKAIAENSKPGALDILAEIAVTGAQPVGLPLVRVVLRDRWTNPVASGVFNAAQYLAAAPSPSRAYAPGTLIPVEIRLEDPGSAAQGYELDVCLPNRRFGLQCKSAGDPFRR
jgi:predicted Zn finger-like uncharacterized protein